MGRTKKSPQKRVEAENEEKINTEPGNVSQGDTDMESENRPSKPSLDSHGETGADKGKKKFTEVPRGVPKSGRVWKTQKQKFSTIKKSLHRRSFEKKEQLREEIRKIKDLSRSIKQQKQQEKEQLKERRETNEKRKLENQRKSEIVQIIKNPAKLKRIRKKQLRMIEKRDLSTVKAI